MPSTGKRNNRGPGRDSHLKENRGSLLVVIFEGLIRASPLPGKSLVRGEAGGKTGGGKEEGGVCQNERNKREGERGKCSRRRKEKGRDAGNNFCSKEKKKDDLQKN